jgi:hypothetical protein
VIALLKDYLQRRAGESPFEETLHEMFADPEVIMLVTRHCASQMKAPEKKGSGPFLQPQRKISSSKSILDF